MRTRQDGDATETAAGRRAWQRAGRADGRVKGGGEGGGRLGGRRRLVWRDDGLGRG